MENKASTNHENSNDGNNALPAVSWYKSLSLNQKMALKEEIEKLKKRREMAVFQRKITTQLLTAIEYDNEIGAIDRRLEQLQYKLKAEQRSSLNAL
jgi:hypothetical protein